MSATFKDIVNLYQQGNNVKAYKMLKKLKNKNFVAYKLLMLLAHQNNDHLKSISIGKHLLEQTTDANQQREILYLMSICALTLNKPLQSITFLEQSVTIDSSSNNAKAMFELLNMYIEKNMLVKVEALAPKIAEIDFYKIPSQLILLEAAAISENKTLLKERLKNFLPLTNKLNTADLCKVFLYFIGAEMFTESEMVIEQYEHIHKGKLPFLRAELLLKQKQFDDVITLLEQYDLKQYQTADPCYALGKAYDKIKNYDNAFKCFTLGSQLAKESITESSFKDAIPAYNTIIEKLTNHKTESSIGNNMVFIVGFPRSGTTLLDNILDTQDITVLSEKDILSGVLDVVAELGYNYPQDICKISETHLIELRKAYFQRIEGFGLTIPENQLIVEKSPHYTPLIPFINLLFPNAKIINTIRHPMDTCLSCFQQNFALKGANTQLTTLEDITDRYNNVFKLLERYQEKMDLNLYTIRYEDLVNNFDDEMKKLFNFIDLAANDSYKTFYQHASNKFINSASRGQTDQQLFNSSIEKWRNYQTFLTPYISKLEYFINKFGYNQ